MFSTPCSEEKKNSPLAETLPLFLEPLPSPFREKNSFFSQPVVFQFCFESCFKQKGNWEFLYLCEWGEKAFLTSCC
jgi:hypothetical protein